MAEMTDGRRNNGGRQPGAGRRAVELDVDEVRAMLRRRMTYAAIASELQCSRTTVGLFIKTHGLHKYEKDQARVLEHVAERRARGVTGGVRMLVGSARVAGMLVSRECGMIDGHTRRIIYNEAATVTAAFEQSCARLGEELKLDGPAYPVRVRADNGGENLGVDFDARAADEYGVEMRNDMRVEGLDFEHVPIVINRARIVCRNALNASSIDPRPDKPMTDFDEVGQAIEFLLQRIPLAQTVPQ